ncbi:hypothetical protein [Aeromonas rivipollensis]|uniref:Phage protein n=1 Tax=Aeromonas rivipollensis TaxID=948519 RepID=A0AAW9YI68_9GAMM|nr:hypothetical protein [Aeromonas rivipollensis]NEX77232.1 hypothetical protein [Aeromonas rivipollensis]
MKKAYDLTNLEGLRKAAKDARNGSVIGGMFGPQLWLLEKGFGLLERAIDTVSPAKAVKAQAQAAADLIKAGKENGVKKMTITMDEQAGIHFDAPIEGAKISFSAGSKGKTTLNVEYF